MSSAGPSPSYIMEKLSSQDADSRRRAANMLSSVEALRGFGAVSAPALPGLKARAAFDPVGYKFSMIKHVPEGTAFRPITVPQDLSKLGHEHVHLEVRI